MRRLLPTTVGVLAVVAVIAVATVIGGLNKTDDDPVSASTPTTRSLTPTATTSPQPTTDETSSGVVESDTPDDTRSAHKDKDTSNDGAKKNKPPQWRTVIDGFAADFTQPGKRQTTKQWRTDLARWLTPDLAKAYTSTDPRSLPNGRLDGITIDSEGDEAVTAIIRYRGITPTWILVQPTPDGWRITQVEPYDQTNAIS